MLNTSVDAAYVYTSGTTRIPTRVDMKELIDNTNNSWASINGVMGRKFISKKDSSKYIFITASGYGNSGIQHVVEMLIL